MTSPSPVFLPSLCAWAQLWSELFPLGWLTKQEARLEPRAAKFEESVFSGFKSWAGGEQDQLWVTDVTTLGLNLHL